MSGPWLISSYRSPWQGAGVARRWALTFSNLGSLWSPLAYLTLPLSWPVMMATVARGARELVLCGPAAAIVPNLNREGQARAPIWPLVTLLPGSFAVVILGSLAAVTYGPQPLSLRVVLALVAALWVSLTLFVIDIAVSGARLFRYRKGFTAWKREVELQTGRVPIVGTMLGAWPRGTGAGTALIAYLRLVNQEHGEVLIGLARTKRVAEAYVAQGAIASAANPLFVAWLPMTGDTATEEHRHADGSHLGGDRAAATRS